MYARRAARDIAYVNTLKAAPCSDCGGTFPPCAMDFDHVRGEKRRGIAAAIGRSRAALLRELEKCELVCANCHRIRTHIRRLECREVDFVEG